MRNKTIILKASAVAVLILTVLSFNWDRIELENRAFVLAMGIDKGQDGGYELSLSIVDTKALEDGGENSPKILHKAEGESLALAMSKAEAKISEKIYYGHIKAIVLGRELLSDSKMMKQTTQTLSSKNEINIRTLIMATDLTAAQILETEPKPPENLLGTYLSGFYSKNNTNTAALVVKKDLESLAAACPDIIPKITIINTDKEEELKIGGVAVLKDYAFKGFVDEDDMAGYLWLTENAAGLRIVQNDATLLIEKSKPKISFFKKENEDKLYCLAEVKVRGYLEGGPQNNLQNPETIFAQKIEKEIEQIFNILQNEYNTDGLRLTEQLRKRHPRLCNGQNTADIELIPRVNLTIRNVG